MFPQKYLFSFSVLAFCLTQFAAAQQPPANPGNYQYVGCLTGSPGAFVLTGENSYYTLTGETAGLEKHVGEEIGVDGPKDNSGGDPNPIVHVERFGVIFHAPPSRLDPRFTKGKWTIHRNEQYGIEFALPDFLKFDAPQQQDSGVGGNFVAQNGTIPLGAAEISGELFPNSNFVGGSFAVFIQPHVKNEESCAQFGQSNPRFITSRTIGSVKYTQLSAGDGSAGTSYEDLYLHTFQNGYCYEIALVLGAYNTGSQDLGCTVSLPAQEDYDKLIDSFPAHVSFFKPAAHSSSKELAQMASNTPRIASFSASSDVADDTKDRGTITFSWSTLNTDYVVFSYACSIHNGWITILDGQGRSCKDNDPGDSDIDQFRRDPSSSLEIGFGNFHDDDPVAVVVTLTPYSHGKPYPNASQSLKISVNPRNPFPKGVHAENRNLTLSYAADANGHSTFHPGSQFKIDWTDSLSRDSCVDLFLVQEDGQDKTVFRQQIIKQCLPPAKGGSYTWTVPDKYLGSGFRIYATTPGMMSETIGPPFVIAR